MESKSLVQTYQTDYCVVTRRLQLAAFIMKWTQLECCHHVSNQKKLSRLRFTSTPHIPHQN